VAIRITDLYRDTAKTCLGRGMHSPGAFSLLLQLLGRIGVRSNGTQVCRRGPF